MRFQLFYRKAAGSNGKALGPNGVRRVNVLGRVPNYDHATLTLVFAKARSSALSADSKQLCTNSVIGPKPTKPETLRQIAALQFDSSALLKVPGAQPHRRPGAQLQGIEHRHNAGMDSVCFSTLDFLGQGFQVELQKERLLSGEFCLWHSKRPPGPVG